MSDLYKIHVQTIDGQDKSMADFRGKALLIVNVASECGFTPQYEGLQKIYDKYKDQGFEVLGFPCNQFGGQEPGDDDAIKTFCDTRFRVKFPMFAKVDVNGEHTHPLYAYLKENKKGLLGTEAIKWNFTKFLVNKDGQVVDRFAPQTKPEDLTKDIEKLI